MAGAMTPSVVPGTTKYACGMGYSDREPRTYVCPGCSRSHSNRSYNRVCSRCQHERRKHPCARCANPCDGRADLCNRCAPAEHLKLKTRGQPTFHKPSGYWLVKVPEDDPMASMRNSQGYVRQHRLVMADLIGRPLTPEEQVHHINQDRGDNRPENLQLMSVREHNAHHAKERRGPDGRFV